MLTTTMKMPEMVAVIVERMYRTMMADPQYLLMQDGGPVGRTAHVVIARLYGADGAASSGATNSPLSPSPGHLPTRPPC